MDFIKSLLYNKTNEKIHSSKKSNLFIINNKELMQLERPECQRAIDNNHVNEILQFQLEHNNKYSEFFFPTPIIVATLNNKNYILDGQHRLACIVQLTQLDHTFNILINILTVEDEAELDAKYIAINKNKLVPLPSNINDWKQFGRHVDEYFQQNYSIYFSKSERPNAPNFNKELLLIYINNNKIASQINCDYELFIKEMENLNIYYQQTYSTSLSKYFSKNITKQIAKSISKQSNKPFILSIYRNFEWVDRVVLKINNKIEFSNMKHVSLDYRIKIKKKIRREVWKKCFSAQLDGNCNTCGEIIDYDSFECGHIKSLFYGGETKLSNLVPICGKCNKDMGIKNLNIYKIELQNQLK